MFPKEVWIIIIKYVSDGKTCQNLMLSCKYLYNLYMILKRNVLREKEVFVELHVGNEWVRIEKCHAEDPKLPVDNCKNNQRGWLLVAGPGHGPYKTLIIRMSLADYLKKISQNEVLKGR